MSPLMLLFRPPPPLTREAKRRAFILAALAALSFVAPGAQAQETINICDRTEQVVDKILLQTTPTDDTCDRVLVSEMNLIVGLSLSRENIASLKSGDFAGLPLGSLFLNNNQLNELPAGIFSGLSNLFVLGLRFNPGAPFRFTVRFEPEKLERDFDVASIRVVLREGAPSTITVPLSVTGGMLESDSLILAAGGIQSTPVTVTRGEGDFLLSQGDPEWDRDRGQYAGFEIVRGPALTVGGVPLRIRVFLEGALE